MGTVVFSGGVGGARFLSGLVRVLPQEEITVISNTGDDSVFFGLYVAPDIDIVTYTLCDMINPETGWGLAGDTFQTLGELSKLGCEDWFNLGDKDLATHIFRTMHLRQGKPLSEVTAMMTKARGLGLSILPMSDERIETIIHSDDGEYAFQEYMVKLRWQVPVRSIEFRGADRAKPVPGVLDAIASAKRIIFAPSNPFVSIGAILAVPGIREALRDTEAKIAAISPIVGGKAIKGPAAALMRDHGYPVSALGVAQIYRGLIDLMVIDRQDETLIPEIQALGIHAAAADTMMTSPEKKAALAKTVLEQLHQIA